MLLTKTGKVLRWVNGQHIPNTSRGVHGFKWPDRGECRSNTRRDELRRDKHRENDFASLTFILQSLPWWTDIPGAVDGVAQADDRAVQALSAGDGLAGKRVGNGKLLCDDASQLIERIGEVRDYLRQIHGPSCYLTESCS